MSSTYEEMISFSLRWFLSVVCTFSRFLYPFDKFKVKDFYFWTKKNFSSSKVNRIINRRFLRIQLGIKMQRHLQIRVKSGQILTLCTLIRIIQFIQSIVKMDEFSFGWIIPMIQILFYIQTYHHQHIQYL